MKFKTGQEMIFEYADHGRTRGTTETVTITAVGRKWLTLSNRLRINAETLIADWNGYSSPGRCYLSESDRNEALARRAAWSELRSKISAKVPDVSAETIINAIKMLRL